jgi:hypothetical protein
VPGEFWCGVAGCGLVRVAAALWRGQAVWVVLVISGGRGLGVWARAACDAERTWDASPEFSLARGPDLRVAFCCR